ncbi:hypothetical protein EMCRGX_G031213 [Ephydatia muelleri]
MSINRDRKRKQAASACVDIRTLFCPSKRTCEQVQSDPLIAPSPLPASMPALTSEPSQKELAVLEEREQPSSSDGLIDGAEFNDEPCFSHSAFVPDNSATVNLTTDGVTSDLPNDNIGLVASGAVIPDDTIVRLLKQSPPLPFDKPEPVYRYVKNGKTLHAYFKHKSLEDYPWLIWSPSRQGAYCALFARLPKGKSHGGGFLGKLVTMSFQNFKKAKGKDGILDTHANYQFHKDAVLHGKEFVLQYDDPDRRIDGIIDKQLQESASFNKLALRSIVECVIFCGKQDISFRGHRDDATASDPTNRAVMTADVIVHPHLYETLSFEDWSWDKDTKEKANGLASSARRGLTSLELSVNQLWRRGPEWLQTGFEPSVLSEVSMPQECMLELRGTQSHSLAAVEHSVVIESIINASKFSTLSRLIGVTMRVLEAVYRFRKKEVPPGTLITRYQEAELLWVKCTQRTLPDFNTLMKQFNLFEDKNGVWHCRGRLENTQGSYCSKYPVLLPKHHPLTILFVKQAHERVLHNGVKETLTEVREKYWIPSGRSVTRIVTYKCGICKRFEGAPLKAPKPPPLPECRVTESPAFSYTGVDFAGPLIIRSAQSSKSNKVWIALFTCYVTRAVHLDTVQDQSTLTFIRCLKRFIARRGLPFRQHQNT